MKWVKLGLHLSKHFSAMSKLDIRYCAIRNTDVKRNQSQTMNKSIKTGFCRGNNNSVIDVKFIVGDSGREKLENFLETLNS